MLSHLESGPRLAAPPLRCLLGSCETLRMVGLALSRPLPSILVALSSDGRDLRLSCARKNRKLFRFLRRVSLRSISEDICSVVCKNACSFFNKWMEIATFTAGSGDEVDALGGGPSPQVDLWMSLARSWLTIFLSHRSILIGGVEQGVHLSSHLCVDTKATLPHPQGPWWTSQGVCSWLLVPSHPAIPLQPPHSRRYPVVERIPARWIFAGCSIWLLAHLELHSLTPRFPSSLAPFRQFRSRVVVFYRTIANSEIDIHASAAIKGACSWSKSRIRMEGGGWVLQCPCEPLDLFSAVMVGWQLKPPMAKSKIEH